MSEYFYIFLDFAIVFGGCVLLLIGAIYAGFYLVVRRTGRRLMTEVDKVVTERIEKERKMNDRHGPQQRRRSPGNLYVQRHVLPTY